MDKEFPGHLHDQLRQFPPCIESLMQHMGMCLGLNRPFGNKSGLVKICKYRVLDKLAPHLHNPVKYVIPYRNLKRVHYLKVKITKLDRVI